MQGLVNQNTFRHITLSTNGFVCGVIEKLRNYVVSQYTYVAWDIQEHYNTPISRYLHRQSSTKACESLNLLDCGRNYYYFLSHRKYFH